MGVGHQSIHRSEESQLSGSSCRATSFKRRCKKCGSENPPEARFCAQCATSLIGQAGQLPTECKTSPPEDFSLSNSGSAIQGTYRCFDHSPGAVAIISLAHIEQDGI